MTAIFMLGVFVVDLGLWVSERRVAQTAADMSAMAGTVELSSLSGTGIETQARTWATMNGYTNGLDGAQVIVHCSGCAAGLYDPGSGPDPTKVEVEVSKPAPLLFASIFKLAGFDVGARAVGGLVSANPPPFNFVSLNNTCENHTLLVRLGGQLTVTSGIYVNSCSSSTRVDGTHYKGDGFDIFGAGGNITAPSIQVVGGWETHDNDTVTISPPPPPFVPPCNPPTQGNDPTHCPQITQPVLGDPFAGKIPAPALGGAAGCPTFATSGTPSLPKPCDLTPGSYTLSPGTYYGGICMGNAIGKDCGGLGTLSCKSGTTSYTHNPTLNLAYNPIQHTDLNYRDSTGAVKNQKNDGMTISQTSLTLSNAAPFLVQNGDTIRIEDEQMLVTAGGGTASLTVTRGVNDTTAAAHGGGKTILHVIDAFTTTITLVKTNPQPIQVNHTIQIDDEQMLVKTVTVQGTETILTVVRSQNGTAADGEVHANDATVVSMALSPTSTTITVSNTDIQTNDTIQIDNERMRVTAGGGTTSLTVTRGQGATVAEAHLDGAEIFRVTPTNTFVTMLPGTYIMAGGGFWVCGSTQLSAPNVMIYNTNDPTNNTGAGIIHNVYLNTNGDVSLGPQAAGLYAGLTIFQNPAMTVKEESCNSKSGDTSGVSWDIALMGMGNGLNGISGTVYAPQQHAMFADSVSGTANLAVLTGCIFIDGSNSTFDFKPGGLFGYGPAMFE
jgi:hypothetical protein